MASVCFVLMFVSCRAASNPTEKKTGIFFMAEAAVDQQCIFGTDITDTALDLPSGLLFLAIIM